MLKREIETLELGSKCYGILKISSIKLFPSAYILQTDVINASWWVMSNNTRMNWKEVLIAVACSTYNPGSTRLCFLHCSELAWEGWGWQGLCDRNWLRADAQIGRFELNVIACLSSSLVLGAVCW